VTDAELANLCQDCLAVWGVAGRVVPGEGGISVAADGVVCTIARAPPERRPARWLMQTDARAAAGKPPQAANSITGLLGGLRDAVGAEVSGPGLDVAIPL
jgi:hypothetical protein